MSTQAGATGMVGQQLAAYLAELQRNAGATIAAAEVGRVLESVLVAAAADKAIADTKIVDELRLLADYIRKAKAEIAALRPQEISGEFIPSATDELDAVVESTERATHAILENAERIDSECRHMAPEVAARVSDFVTEIFTACTFQDVTGQRITKVVRALKDIERRIDLLLSAFGEEVAKLPEIASRPNVSIFDENSLLNGPQLPENAMRQSDVDLMFEKK